MDETEDRPYRLGDGHNLLKDLPLGVEEFTFFPDKATVEQVAGRLKAINPTWLGDNVSLDIHEETARNNFAPFFYGGTASGYFPPKSEHFRFDVFQFDVVSEKPKHWACLAFVVMPSEGNRVELRVRYVWEPEMLPHFARLLNHLAELWPSIADEVREYLRKLSEEHEIELPQAEPATDATETEAQQGGGRPPDPDNEWAYNEVNVKKRHKKDVYPEWCGRRQKAGTIDDLVDPKDSFKKATKFRELRGT